MLQPINKKKDFTLSQINKNIPCIQSGEDQGQRRLSNRPQLVDSIRMPVKISLLIKLSVSFPAINEVTHLYSSH
jgi:hypothetical protein